MRPSRARRPGTTFLELMVAMVVFSIAVAGLCPLVVMQARLLRKIEWQGDGSTNLQLIRGARIINGQPFPSQGPAAAPPPTILQPEPDLWVRRLGAAATFLPESAVLTGIASQKFTPPQSASPSIAVDDADPSFSAPPAWTAQSNSSAVGGSYHSIPRGDTTDSPAAWPVPSQVGPGNYHVLVSWVQDGQNATDATYNLVQGSYQVPLKAVDQTTAPAPGVSPTYRDLGIYYLDSSYQITLGGSATGRVVADAVQLVPVSPPDHSVAIISPPPPPANGVVSVQVSVTP